MGGSTGRWLALVAWLALGAVAQAQQGFGGGSTRNRAGVGTMQSGRVQSGGMGGMGSMQQGMGLSSGMGGMQGMGQMGGMGGMGGMGAGMGQPGMGGMLGGQAQSGFVGRDAQSMRQTMQNLSGRERRTMMFDMMIENLSEMRDSRRGGNRREPAPPARVRIEQGFSTPQTAAGPARQIAVDRARLALVRKGLEGVDATVAGETVVLRGVVAGDYDRQLAEQLFALEPGVGAVDNQLTVAEDSGASSTR